MASLPVFHRGGRKLVKKALSPLVVHLGSCTVVCVVSYTDNSGGKSCAVSHRAQPTLFDAETLSRLSESRDVAATIRYKIEAQSFKALGDLHRGGEAQRNFLGEPFSSRVAPPRAESRCPEPCQAASNHEDRRPPALAAAERAAAPGTSKSRRKEAPQARREPKVGLHV